MKAGGQHQSWLHDAIKVAVGDDVERAGKWRGNCSPVGPSLRR